MTAGTCSRAGNAEGDESVAELVRELDPSMRIRWLLTNMVGVCLALLVGFLLDMVRAALAGTLASHGPSLSFFVPVGIDEEMMWRWMSGLAVIIVAVSLRGPGHGNTRLDVASEGKAEDRWASLSFLVGALAAFLSAGYVAGWFELPMTSGLPADADVVSAALMLTLSQALVALTAVRGVSLRHRAEQARSSLPGFEERSRGRANRWSEIWGRLHGAREEPTVGGRTIAGLCRSIAILVAVPAIVAAAFAKAGPYTQSIGAGSMVLLLLMHAFLLCIKAGFASSARRMPRPFGLVMVVVVLVVFVAPVVLILGQSFGNWPWWAVGAAMVIHSLQIFLKGEGTSAGQGRTPGRGACLWSPWAMERLYVGLVHRQERRRRKSAERYVKIHQELISTVDRMGKAGRDTGFGGPAVRIELSWGRPKRPSSGWRPGSR